MGVKSHRMSIEENTVKIAVHGSWKALLVETELLVGAMSSALKQDGGVLVDEVRMKWLANGSNKRKSRFESVCTFATGAIGCGSGLPFDLVMRGCQLRAAIRSNSKKLMIDGPMQ